MELANGLSPRHNSNSIIRDKNEEIESSDLENSIRSDHGFHSTSALEILRESVRILRYNLSGFMSIMAVLICPVSALLLSNILSNQNLVKRLNLQLLLLAKSSGIPLNPYTKQSCQKISEMAVSNIMCFPLFLTLSLVSKTAVIYTVDCTYSRKKFDLSKFYTFISKIWKRIVLTYLCTCIVISGCLVLFLVLLGLITTVFTIMGFELDLILYPAILIGLIFAITLANAIIICNVSIIISILEDFSGPEAILKSRFLIKGQTQVGLLIFLGSAICMAFVEGLFDHRVKKLSYGDGSSRIWEGPLLVVMYSFVILIDSMMSTIFYFSCKFYSTEFADVESELELVSEGSSF